MSKHKDRRVKNIGDMDEFDLAFHGGNLSYQRMWFSIGLIALGLIGGAIFLLNNLVGLSPEMVSITLGVVGVAFVVVAWRVYVLTKKIGQVDAQEEKVKTARWDLTMKPGVEAPLNFTYAERCPTCGTTVKYRNTENSSEKH